MQKQTFYKKDLKCIIKCLLKSQQKTLNIIETQLIFSECIKGDHQAGTDNYPLSQAEENSEQIETEKRQVSEHRVSESGETDLVRPLSQITISQIMLNTQIADTQITG
ncbi:Hypothetical_protein [Hexamita inflata]|uniref:Hypothetical_protein n=1 Tax=Hexamita inflata TaxID=28002 RepID=A0AA86PQ50_9EUKA|nr:Hypothetical protein HINF_LOCUS31296 [Hexamita inflata]